MRSILSLTVMVLLLCGCRSILDPSFMPSGYQYHHYNQAYKGPPGPEAPGLGYDYSYQTNENIMQMWRLVASDLINEAESQAGLVPQPIYLEPLPANNAFNASYDHVLREEFKERGYELQSVKRSNLHVFYEASLVGEDLLKEKHERLFNDEPPPESADKVESPDTFEFSMTMIPDGAWAKTVKIVHSVPAYGYRGGTSRWLPVVGTQPLNEKVKGFNP